MTPTQNDIDDLRLRAQKVLTYGPTCDVFVPADTLLALLDRYERGSAEIQTAGDVGFEVGLKESREEIEELEEEVEVLQNQVTELGLENSRLENRVAELTGGQS